MTGGAGGRGTATALRCAECGEPIRPGRASGTWVHASRVVASCDLDSDHPAVPAGADGAPIRTTATPEGGT
jgi:hypothetical protein